MSLFVSFSYIRLPVSISSKDTLSCVVEAGGSIGKNHDSYHMGLPPISITNKGNDDLETVHV